jgi:L-glutamine---4-(methylsulfanyl)-2-oxobutanoate aminotransferase
MSSINDLNSKVGRFGSCITRGMSVEAASAGAWNLSQGFPDDPPPQEVASAAINAIISGRNHYADFRGLPELRSAVAGSMKRFHNVDWVDGDKHVTITCGATEAMLMCLLTLIDEKRGDEVILFEPWYENYWPQVILSGATLRTVILNPPDYRVTEDLLASVFNPRTKAIVITNPGNPTGRVLTKSELELIAEFCKRYDTVAIVDEIYCHYVFDGRQHISLASFPDVAERTITINGISKCFACTGWRVGWAVTPAQLTPAVRRVHDFITATVPTPFQIGAVAALNLPDEYFGDLRKRYEEKREILCSYLDRTPLQFKRPEGAYYVLADIRNTGFTSTNITDELLKRAKVAVVPGRAYHQNTQLSDSVIRLTFSKSDDVLCAAGESMVKFFMSENLT